ncbi:bifunctional phosphopantothenoylcysteine decarboxylase/phosphopantothenate--cysteine ligase CoaBC [Agathobaculum sp. NTUH-O15-33]|uniref:bifunctional phosphopantothenoylcysteine decarboxylase/phosphopantothenate--cysteine ligase CoaBC n=1 Tax=Agathobaculum sp. NTUH-O15-33 TaxID=3079302 RepID=UPI002958B61A|nr:bifunctional phosphopantothenoylcysteine decarboxylase/phosphopantothenate--cysteine ligase CoaBC [Agathobaculum sp. NTUH-O15-33]WNX85385.1 bifunctional phosphopantothenoylcysteine decarboxylase/phosphopantothenate--cysteine ligase CoaBC [Agathobaculum sp. NTUH-O15-33]
MGLTGKTVVLCVTGGIAAYKAADLTSKLRGAGAEVRVLMTASATEFITPVTFETLSGFRAIVDTFDRDFAWEVEHISLAKAADVFVIAPATANVIAKAAHGIADDMVTTTLLATGAPVVVAPAMNTGMYDNPVTQQNLATLRARGVLLVEPAAGRLACGDTGRGKLADTAEIMHVIERALTRQDLAGRRVLVTAGPTQEALDPVRFLSNHSSGKMGYAVAARAALRGAEVTLVSGPTALSAPRDVAFVPVASARDMYDAVLSRADAQDIIVKAAAVGDYRPAEEHSEKIKKAADDMTLPLTRNPDILAALGGRKKPGQLLCGFAMETRDLIQNAQDKLRRKNCDMLVANSLRDAGAGFQHDTNAATLLFADGSRETAPLMRKEELADLILDRLLELA